MVAFLLMKVRVREKKMIIIYTSKRRTCDNRMISDKCNMVIIYSTSKITLKQIEILTDIFPKIWERLLQVMLSIA